mgnify:CR=1
MDSSSLRGQYYVAFGIDQLFIDTLVKRVAEISNSFHGTGFEAYRPEIVCVIEVSESCCLLLY